jgi:phosphopentomutase
MPDPAVEARPRRAVVIVLDSVGIGELPDAPVYGDEGSNTLGNISAHVRLHLPTLTSLGLTRLVALRDQPAPPIAPMAAYGRMREASPGKDSVTGHWELMGLVLDRPFPTFPHGFPPDVIAAFEARIGRKSMANVVGSGTEIMDRFGAEHMRTGHPIVYTSADSVFQILAHEDVIPIEEQYAICRAAYALVVEGMGVGRVIARPFVGAPGAFTRTANRHDYAMPPVAETLLDRLTARGVPVHAVGKVSDLFAGRGVTTSRSTASDDDGVTALVGLMDQGAPGLLFANLVDFDTKYGHRNDVAGYAANLMRFDARLPEVLDRLTADDLLVITADHGNDPTTPSTDHSREYVPLLVLAPWLTPGRPLGDRETFADVGQTIADHLGVGALAHGTSLLSALR